MKTMISIATCLAAAWCGLAVTLPDGFVYRAKCEPGDKGSPHLKEVDVTMRLYSDEKAAIPTWTGEFKGVSLTNDLFQIWVSEDAHNRSVEGEDTLEQVLWKGAAAWIGISFGTSRECQPRRKLVTTPMAKVAMASETLDPVAEVDDLVECEKLTAADAKFGDIVCDTVEFGDVSNVRLNVKQMTVNSIRLLRDADNAILVTRTQCEWTQGMLEPGMAITNMVGQAAFLTLRSTDSLTAPLISVPVPAGEAFVWQAAPTKCTWRFIAIGAE